MKLSALIGICFLIVSTHSAVAHEGATGVVKERMDRFKESKETMKALKGALDDPARVEVLGQDLLAWAQEMTDYFPPDSNPAPSEARDRIWEEFDAFKKLASEYAEATQAMIDTARAGETDQIPTAYRNVGQACKNCHKKYKE